MVLHRLRHPHFAKLIEIVWPMKVRRRMNCLGKSQDAQQTENQIENQFLPISFYFLPDLCHWAGIVADNLRD